MKACVLQHLHWCMATLPSLSQSGMRCSFEFAQAVYAELISTSPLGHSQSAKAIIPGHHVVGGSPPLKSKYDSITLPFWGATEMLCRPAGTEGIDGSGKH